MIFNSKSLVLSIIGAGITLWLYSGCKRSYNSEVLLNDKNSTNPNAPFNQPSKLKYLQICSTDAILTKETTVNATLYQQEKYTPSNICTTTDANFRQTGKDIKIKLHGNYSLKYAQKSYSFKFIDKQGNSIETEFQPLPKGKAWNFNSPFLDRSLIRNAITYKIGQEMGESRGVSWFAPRYFHTELAINGDYKGVYLVVERGEKNKNRVDIPAAKIETPEDVNFIGEFSSEDGEFKTKNGSYININYPDGDKRKEWKASNPDAANKLEQNIKNRLDSFEDSLAGPNFKDPTTGYAANMDVLSFIDYLLLQELTKNFDGLRRSMWFHVANGGKITMGPIWDFDLGYANVVAISSTKGWLSHRSNYFGSASPVFWFKRLLQDPNFVAKVIARYKELRQPGKALNADKLNTHLLDFEVTLGNAAQRNENRWLKSQQEDLINAVFVHAPPWQTTFTGNLNQIRAWISTRLSWIDENINKIGEVEEPTE